MKRILVAIMVVLVMGTSAYADMDTFWKGVEVEVYGEHEYYRNENPGYKVGFNVKWKHPGNIDIGNDYEDDIEDLQDQVDELEERLEELE